MTETTPNAADEAARYESLYRSQMRTNGTLVNEVQALREGLAERDRKIADISDRLEDAARAVMVNSEMFELLGERCTLVENLLLAELADRDEREAFVQTVMPGRTETQRRVRALLGTAKSIEGANRR